MCLTPESRLPDLVHCSRSTKSTFRSQPNPRPSAPSCDTHNIFLQQSLLGLDLPLQTVLRRRTNLGAIHSRHEVRNFLSQCIVVSLMPRCVCQPQRLVRLASCNSCTWRCGGPTGCRGRDLMLVALQDGLALRATVAFQNCPAVCRLDRDSPLCPLLQPHCVRRHELGHCHLHSCGGDRRHRPRAA